MFKAPFSFEGRIRRTEFGLSVIILGIALVAIIALTDIVGDWALVGIIPALWFRFAQACKRCHDRGNSGIWQFIPYYSLWLLFADSEFGYNEYGPNPKNQGNFDDVSEFGKHLKS